MTTHDRSVWDVIRADRWLLEAMLPLFPHGCMNVLDRDYRTLFLAGAGIDQLTVPPAVLIGMPLDDLLTEEDAARIRPFYARAFAGETVRFTAPICGREHRIRAAPVVEPDGTIGAIVAVAQAIPAPVDIVTAIPPRQREIAVLIAAGLPNKQIARRLGITTSSVRNQIADSLKRLSLSSRTQIGVWAATHGLYRPGDDDGGQHAG